MTKTLGERQVYGDGDVQSRLDVRVTVYHFKMKAKKRDS